MYNANGVVAAHRDELFSCVAGKYIARRKRRVSDAKAKASTRKLRRRQQVRKGRLAELRPDVRRSVFEVSRTTGRVTYVTHARADAAAADADSIRRDDVKKQALLDKQVKTFCKAMEKIDVAPIVGDDVIMGRTTLASHKRQLAAHLGQIDSVPKRTRVLKENLERLVDGMGHSELKVGWAYSSKDRTPEQNVTFLMQKLEESWELIKEKKLPLSSDPICPALYTRKLPTHGEPTLQRAAFDTEQPRTAAELRAEAEAMVAERAQGARSSSGRRSRLCRDPPEITAALIGERVDVLYRLSYDVIEPVVRRHRAGRPQGRADGPVLVPGRDHGDQQQQLAEQRRQVQGRGLHLRAVRRRRGGLQPRVAAVVLRREQARLVAARGNRRGRGRRRRRRRRRRHGDGRRRCCDGRRR